MIDIDTREVLLPENSFILKGKYKCAKLGLVAFQYKSRRQSKDDFLVVFCVQPAIPLTTAYVEMTSRSDHTNQAELSWGELHKLLNSLGSKLEPEAEFAQASALIDFVIRRSSRHLKPDRVHRTLSDGSSLVASVRFNLRNRGKYSAMTAWEASLKIIEE